MYGWADMVRWCGGGGGHGVKEAREFGSYVFLWSVSMKHQTPRQQAAVGPVVHRYFCVFVFTGTQRMRRATDDGHTTVDAPGPG